MKRITIMLAAVLVLSVSAIAATQATNTTTVSPTLTISATIQKAVSLTLSTGTAAVSHCSVAAGGGPPDYTMNFGNVDALGVNAGNCNKFAPATPGTTDAVYWSDYTLTPVYTSHQASSNSKITAQVTTDFGTPNNIYIVRDTANSATVPASVGSFTAMGTSSADQIASTVASGTALTRYIGVGVKPTNSATALQGAQSATVTFTLTVQ